MSRITEIEGAKIVTLEKLNNSKWDEKVAIVDECQISFGFLKWNDNRESMDDFRSYSLVGKDEFIKTAKAILK